MVLVEQAFSLPRPVEQAFSPLLQLNSTVNPLHRIIDASANRAREALRVMEDIARFALNHPALISQLKSLRHDLQSALSQPLLDRALLLASRSVESDEGLSLKTPTELARAGLPAVAAAAAARLTESLRSIEESAKALGADPLPIERLRYAAYTAEQALLLALGPRRCPQWSLCILITESLCTHHPWHDVARQALAAGADCLQLREKSLPDRELLARARTLVDLAQSSVPSPPHSPLPSIIINDRPDIALLAGADGVHLGQTDLPIDEVRKLAGFRLLIGLSTTNLDQAHAAANAGADYCGLGPMFPTTTKHKPTLAGPAYARAYLADPIASQLPHLAIGGITPDNLTDLIPAGVRGIAVSSAVCSAPDPAEACRRLIAVLPPSSP